MPVKVHNPLLRQTERAIKAKVPPHMQSAFRYAVTTGMALMQSHRQLVRDQLSKPGDMAQHAGTGASMLLDAVLKQSKRPISIAEAVPAAVIFLCEILDFLEREKQTQVSNDLLANAMFHMSALVLQRFGVSEGMMNNMVSEAVRQQEAGPDYVIH